MKVSFIVPVYNVEKYISECIESILHQTEKSFEIILVNDGSSDASGRICEKYAEVYNNIKIVHQENQGVSVARNRGISISEGEWVFFVDGDDTISSYLLETCKPYLINEYDVCFIKHKETVSGRNIEDSKNNATIAFIPEEDFKEFELAIFNRDYRGKYDYHNVKMATPCKFYRKGIIDKYNVKFPKGIATGEDAIFNLLFYKNAKKGVYIDEELYYHRIWGNSVSQGYDPNVEKKFELFHSKLKEIIENSDNPERFKSVYNERCIWSIGFCCILNYCNANNPNRYKKRKKDFIKVREKYIEEVKRVQLKNFRIEKQILFLCIKLNWFWLINKLCFLKKKV